MKLKTLVGSMALLGLVSTGAFAATAQKVTNESANAGNDFWKSVIYRNQDNNGTMPTVAQGGFKVTGEVATDYFHSDRRSGFADEKGKSGFNLHTAELYFDAQVNNMVSAHAALDYDANLPNTGTGTNSSTSLTEAYATLKQGNLFLNAGLQYLNFGSTSHDTLLVPVVEQLTTINTTSLDFGIMNLGGFYADAALFNGAAYGTDASKIKDTANKANGFTVELGYAMNQGANPFYGFNGLNAYVDYINDVADTNLVKATGAGALSQQHPGVALHAGYVTGPFQLTADYVTVTKAIDEYKINNSAVKPSAYNLEADYSWNTMNVQTVTLALGGAKNAAGLPDNAAYGPTSTPETRVSLTYGYHLSPEVLVQGEYANEKDFSTGNGGTGKSANILVGRLKVAF